MTDIATAVPMLDLLAEYAALKPEIDVAIDRVLASGQFVLGAEVADFEAAFARYVGQSYTVGVGSGTAALLLALLAADLQPGDEVITAANTDVATTMAISFSGARVVLADVDPRTFTIDPDQIAARITARTRAVVPVHLFGQPADMDRIMALAYRYDLLVIEDATLAVGAEYGGRKAGAIGLAGCYSFAPGKILGAYGDAGAVTTNDPELAERLRVLRNYGHDPSMVDRTGSTRFDGLWRIVAEGLNERLDSLQAAVLLAKLPTLETRIAARRRIAARYDEELADLALLPPAATGHRHVFRAYTILVDNRDEVRRHLAASGIETRVYYAPPVHLQPAYRYLGFGSGSFPVAEAVADRMLSLPIFPEMTDGQIDHVISALRQAVPAK
jgi:dTDP-4-amino-4,6-dideoxygalactose transaminase